MRYENYREACYHCDYASSDKPSDITLGDYFEAKSDYPELFVGGVPLYNNNYINALLVHTTKGYDLINKLSKNIETIEVDTNIMQLSHKQLCIPPNYSYVRYNAIKIYNRKGIIGLNSYILKEGLLRKLIIRK